MCGCELLVICIYKCFIEPKVQESEGREKEREREKQDANLTKVVRYPGTADYPGGTYMGQLSRSNKPEGAGQYTYANGDVYVG